MCGSCSYKIRQKDVVGGEKRKEGDQAEAARTKGRVHKRLALFRPRIENGELHKELIPGINTSNTGLGDYVGK
jgi:hypothetical protein